LRFQENSWVIEDLGSSNGIIFAGERVAKRALQSGDVFQIGRTTLRLMGADSLAEVEELFDTLERVRVSAATWT
jgi:pSer/pThr/pTyr-binding forkhead associated (FHA) protein